MSRKKAKNTEYLQIPEYLCEKNFPAFIKTRFFVPSENFFFLLRSPDSSFQLFYFIHLIYVTVKKKSPTFSGRIKIFILKSNLFLLLTNPSSWSILIIT